MTIMNSKSLCNIILVISIYEAAVCQIILPDDSRLLKKCGVSTLHSTDDIRIVDGTLSRISNFPWLAGLYYRQIKNGEESWEQTCAGSLITDQFVLTAAHCVYNTNARDFRVALGKIYRSWDRDEYSQQKRNVTSIQYPGDYQQVTYYFDIALLLLDEKIIPGKYVMPVCIGFLGVSNDIINKKLYVAGWGQTKDVQSGSPSETLVYTDVSFLHKITCQKFIPVGSVIFDKFCTVKNNNTGVSVIQKGDSGGGLTVVYNGKHYIFGIVSVKIGRQNESQMTLFTNITWPNHVFWIENQVGKYHSGFKWTAKELTPDIVTVTRRCVLPDATPDKKFCSLENGCDESCDYDSDVCTLTPGSSVELVKVLCAPGYSTPDTSVSEIAVCQGNSWYPPIPECQKACRPRKSDMLIMTCRYDSDVVDCSKPALPGTTVTFKCATNFLEDEELSRDGAYNKVHTCSPFGEWSDNLPICKSACGVFKKGQTLTPSVVNGQKANASFFPWHAGLYYRTEESGIIIWEQKCGGTVITNRVILTAASCVEQVYTYNIRVSVGKYYRSWDVIELNEQKLNVKTTAFPYDYSTGTTPNDIALVLLNETIRFNEHVMPVCRDVYQIANVYWNLDLYVTGWGKTIRREPSKVLFYNTVTAVEDNECQKAVTTGYTSFQTICTVISSNYSVPIVQSGDYGGGLTAVFKDGLYYMFGVFSRKVGHVSLFTNSNSRHLIDWVEDSIIWFKDKYD